MDILRLSFACMGMFAASIATAVTADTPNHCTLEKAVYASPKSSLHLSFINVGHRKGLISNVALRIVEPRTNHLFWYYFDEGSAPRISLISTTNVTTANWSPDPDDGKRPYGRATFIGLKRNGEMLVDTPSAESPSPEYIIIPELAELFKTIRLWGVETNAFVFASCKK